MDRTHRFLFAALTASLGLSAVACAGGSAPNWAKANAPASEPAPVGGKSGAPADKDSDGLADQDAPAAPQAGAPGSPPPPPVSAAPEAPSSAHEDRGSSQGPKADKSAELAPQPTNRPGLGTEWGETRSSHITTVPFIRADDSNPIATTSLFYNDEEGARAMASSNGFRRTSSGSFTIAHGTISVALRDEGGSFLSGFVSDGHDFVIGDAGHRYTIVLKNLTGQRFECVVSVDGLDVLDGRDASFGKRGYLLDPHAELEVDGFRQSMDAVAAFRFGSVRSSYANQKHGETRNVGVIGIALFNERGSSASPWTVDEVEQRRSADPFPGRFATPPR